MEDYCGQYDPRPRGIFTFKDYSYNLPLTVPNVSFDINTNNNYDVYLTISLSEKHDATGLHYKLIAGVILAPKAE